MRRTIQVVVLLLCVGLLVRTWLVQGLLAPLEVASGSMAQTLLGPHREVECRECGGRFAVDAAAVPAETWAECPRCGFLENEPGGPILSGDRVILDRTAFSFRKPRRWEVIAFHGPERPSQVLVKRVVGLPGETVEIRDGDVYIDGRIARKDLAQQRALAILVDDAEWESPSDATPRWRPARPDSQWTQCGGTFSHPGAAADGIDWIEYHHSPDAGEIDNRLAHNAGLRRAAQDLHPMGDLLLSLQVQELSGAGVLTIRACCGQEVFQVRLDFSSVLRTGESTPVVGQDATLPSKGAAIYLPVLKPPARLEISLIDRQLLVAADGTLLAAIPFDGPEAQPPSPPKLPPFSIGCQGLRITLGGARLWRDVYYTRPPGLRGRGVGKPFQLGDGEYFVLGDNSAVSDDSRTWAEGACVEGANLLGRPLLVGLAWRPVRAAGMSFQVPATRRIRYIR
jgi:signal peptidase I